MKSYLFLLLSCFSLSTWAQVTPGTPSESDFTISDVKFNSMGITLEGAIYKPKQITAALVIVHGSGKEVLRTEMATLFAKNGIAVLIYDKRGVGKSGGTYVGPEVGTNNIDSANLHLLATDASAAANTLLANLPAKHGPVGLLGFSQAGWVIPLAVQKNPKLNFMVLFSGPVINTLEQLRFQFYTQGNTNFWDTHTEAEARMHTLNDPDRYPFAATDPIEVLKTLSAPGLWIFGGKDIQVPVGLSIDRLETLRAKGKSYTHHVFPELGHNTAFSKSPEPVNLAIEWIKNIKTKKGK